MLARAGERHGRKLQATVWFEEKAGLVNMDLTRENGAVVAARHAAPVPLKTLSDEYPVELIADACSLEAERHLHRYASVAHLPRAARR